MLVKFVVLPSPAIAPPSPEKTMKKNPRRPPRRPEACSGSARDYLRLGKVYFSSSVVDFTEPLSVMDFTIPTWFAYQYCLVTF